MLNCLHCGKPKESHLLYYICLNKQKTEYLSGIRNVLNVQKLRFKTKE